MTHFKDHFSGYARGYEAYRPAYPKALIGYLGSIAPGQGRVWDCATGNGQAALMLAEQFASVLATDASRQQVEQARRHDRLQFVVDRAERTPLPTASVDLVTVAQAVHWFNL